MRDGEGRMRDDECTMSVHRAIASKSDDERKAVAGMGDDERQGVLEQGSILERNTRNTFSRG